MPDDHEGLLGIIEQEGGRLLGPDAAYDIRLEGEPDCILGCPAGVDVKAYIGLIGAGRYEEAVEVIRRANPFPGICGRVCTHPCEQQCGRKEIDEPLAIRELKRFASDYEMARRSPAFKGKKTEGEKRVAVIGGGPAGLTAANDLALAGVGVTVFDDWKEPGGLMAWGIPDFRLPKGVLRFEVNAIRGNGVEIECGRRVDDPAGLLEDGYDAVVLAAGCREPVLPGIPGQDAPGVVDCLEFLMNAHGGGTGLSGKVLVIGGGNAALDAARTARRLGADVTVAYRRTQEQMPADAGEVEQAVAEGIEFRFLAIPRRVLVGDDGVAAGMEFQGAELGEPDASGRPKPVPVPGSEFTLEADMIILALGSRPEPALVDAAGLETTGWGTVKVDGQGMTSRPGIFAAGDIVTGPASIVDAIGSGHVAAAGIMRFLGMDSSGEAPGKMLVVESPMPGREDRRQPPLVPAAARQNTFDEVELGMPEGDALAEARRCRRCGSCSVCEACLPLCDYRNCVMEMDGGGRLLAKIPYRLALDAAARQDGWTLEAGEISRQVTIKPLLASVDRNICISCGRCEEACPYAAIRTVFDTEGGAHAEVSLDACRGCGACAGACPTGAIDLGAVSNRYLAGELRRAVTESRKGDGTVRFSCIWHSGDFDMDRQDAVMVQCTRRLSPWVLVEALALGAGRVLVDGCGLDDCHYLPGPWMGQDVVDSARNILAAVGTDPARVEYLADGEPDREISGPQGDANVNLPDVSAPLGRCLNAVQVLMARPDVKPEPPDAGGRYLLAPGCLAMFEPAFAAYNFPRDNIIGAAESLLASAGIGYLPVEGIHISGESLRDWGMETLYSAYSGRVRGLLAGSNSRGLIVPTPKTFQRLRELHGDVIDVVSLPSVLLGSGIEFAPADITVGYHHACAGGGEWDDECLELLARVPGLRIVRLEGECGDTGWRMVGSGTRQAAMALLRSAQEAGCDMLVCGSTRCSAHLEAVTGGWSQTSVGVTDIIKFLASCLPPGDQGVEG